MLTRVLSPLLLLVLAAPSAYSQDLGAMFQDAYGWLQPMESMSHGMATGYNQSSARDRILKISDKVPELTSALLRATDEPTEEARIKVCQLTARVNDMFLGADSLDGAGALAGSFEGLKQAIQGARTALQCTQNIPSFCPAPLSRSFTSQYVDVNGNRVDARIQLTADGNGTGKGSYRLNDGSEGHLSGIRCFDNGTTMKARWEYRGAVGFATFYYIDAAKSEFLGIWGDESIGRPIFQGFWDGKTGQGSSGGLAEGQYTLRARHSGKCLDVRDHSLDNGARLQQWECTGEAHQTFKLRKVRDDLYTLEGLQSRRCVSAEAAHYENGVPMIQWDCANGPDQLVRLVPSTNGSYTVRFSHSGKCMDVAYFSNDNGLDVHQWDCSGGADQDWNFLSAGSTSPVTPAPGGVAIDGGARYSLVSRQSGKCLDAVDGSVENATVFQQWDCNQGSAQAFHFRDVGGGYYNLVNDNSGRCVSAEAVKTDNGTPMILWDCNGGPDQKVRLQASVGGNVKVLFQHSGKCMDVRDGSLNAGTRIQQWDCNGQANQDWILRKF